MCQEPCQKSEIKLFGENTRLFLAAKTFTVLPQYIRKIKYCQNIPKKTSLQRKGKTKRRKNLFRTLTQSMVVD